MADLKRRNTQLDYSRSLKRARPESVERFPVKPAQVPELPSKVQTEILLGLPWPVFPKHFKHQSDFVCDGSSKQVLFVLIQEQVDIVDAAKRLCHFEHPQILPLLAVYQDGGTTFLVSEYLGVSLRNIAALGVKLTAGQLRFICVELIEGLRFLHNRLGIFHGSLSCDKIALDSAGSVKISSVPHALIAGNTITQDGRRGDIRSIGLVMIELMEQTTSASHPDTLKLRDPGQWSADAVDFLASTDTLSLDDLAAHAFMAAAPEGERLRTLVLRARKYTYSAEEFDL